MVQQAPKREGIVWIASFPKSGNTWVRAFLANYVFGTDQQLFKNMSRFCPGDRAMSLYQDTMKTLGISQDDLSNQDKQYEVRSQGLRHMAKKRKGMFFFKTHAAHHSRKGVEYFPTHLTASAIHIVRNPMDVAPSLADHWNIPLEKAVNRMMDPKLTLERRDDIHTSLEFTSSWAAHTRSWLSSGLRVHTVRYEDLVISPEREFTKMVEFLFGGADKKKIFECVAKTRFQNLKKREQKEGFPEKSRDNDRFFRNGVCGSGRQELSDEAIFKLLQEINKTKPPLY